MAINLRKKSDPILRVVSHEETTPQDVEQVIQSEWQEIELSKTSSQWIDHSGQVRRVETYHKDKELKAVKCLNEYGKLDGEQIENYPGGKLKSSIAYKNGLRHGKELQLNDKEVVLLRMFWDKDQPHGFKETFYGTKNIKERIPYVEGKINGTREEFHENGSLKSETFYGNDLIEGAKYEYDSKGKLVLKTQFKNGLKHGLEDRYNEKQQLSSRAEYKQGKKHGLSQSFSEGKLFSETNYQNDYRQGVSRQLNSYGEEFTEVHYEKDKKNGDQIVYTKLGEIKRITPYRNDQPHGISKELNPHTGETISKYYYWKGNYISKSKYWLKSNTENITHLRISRLWSSLWAENSDMMTKQLYLENHHQSETRLLDIAKFKNTPNS